jgi:hypothetical protein
LPRRVSGRHPGPRHSSQCSLLTYGEHAHRL